MDVKLTTRAVLGVAAIAGMLTTPVSIAAIDKPTSPGHSREKASVDQMSALKPQGSEKLKSATAPQATYYAYDRGVRRTVSMTGSGTAAEFQWDGSGTKLRFSGQVLFKTNAPLSASEVSNLASGFGVFNIQSRDESGTQWSGQTPGGLEGIQMVNRFQESGKISEATLNWQRDLVKK